MPADPQWVRETLCEDLADLARQRGKLPDTRAIEETIDEDIRLFQAENRERKVGAPLPTAQERDPEERHSIAKSKAEDANARLGVTDNVGDEVLPAGCECGGHCRLCKMRARMLQLIEPVPMAERKLKVEWWLNCRYPKYAKEVIEAYGRYKFSGQAIRGENKKQRNLAMVRRLEDICTRSNSLIGLGEWDA